MKKLFILIMLACLICPAFGQQVNSVGTSWTQQYRLWGFELYDEDYVHPGIVAEIEGAKVEAVSHFREDEDWQYWDTAVNYTLPAGGLYVRPGYGYFKLPGEVDVQEASITLGIVGNLSPRITASHIIPENEAEEGQVYTVGVDMGMGDPNGIQACLSVEVTYNDGVNPLGGKAERDWTHLTAGLQLKIPIEKFTLIPAVVYQYSFEPELLGCDEDEVWAAASIVRKF